MRSGLGEAVVIGVGAGAAVMIIHALIGDAPPATQLMAVLFAGMVLGGFQLALGRRRRPRRARPPAPPATLPVTPAAPAAIDDRDGVWTGLAVPLHQPAVEAAAEAARADQPHQPAAEAAPEPPEDAPQESQTVEAEVEAEVTEGAGREG